jgi:hypothetical protein
VIEHFKRELARSNGNMMTPISSRFVGMMKQDLESIYDLLPMTPGNMYSESNSEGNCHLLRECNMLHLLEDGATSVEDVEDNAYPIPCTLEEQVEYD